MQNKDGIKIEVGQVWRGEKHCLEVVGFTNQNSFEYVVCRSQTTKTLYDGYSTERQYFDTLIKTSNGADLGQARKDGWEIWVGGMEEPDYNKIEEAELFESAISEWKPCKPMWVDSIIYRYKLKPQEPEQPERLEIKILRGMARDVVSAPSGGVGVNTIKQAVSHMLGEYNLIGYKYAESRYISTFGPNAWWKECLSKECCVHYNNGNEYYPVLATHAIYQRVK